MASVVLTGEQETRYRGLRMNAGELLAVGETNERFELIDGVVCMSPRPTFRHHRIVTELAIQIGNYVASNPVGDVAVESEASFESSTIPGFRLDFDGLRKLFS